jgi:hypothetical protein
MVRVPLQEEPGGGCDWLFLSLEAASAAAAAPSPICLWPASIDAMAAVVAAVVRYGRTYCSNRKTALSYYHYSKSYIY